MKPNRTPKQSSEYFEYSPFQELSTSQEIIWIQVTSDQFVVSLQKKKKKIV